MSSQSILKKLLITLSVIACAGLFAWAGSSHGATVGVLPIFAAAVILAFVVQWVVFVPSQIVHSERFFDLTGSITYTLITLVLLFVIPERSPRAIVLGLLVIIWAVRLGTFLFRRISRDGSDSRFDEIKRSPLRFFNVWTIQGLWITITASAAWIAMTSDNQAPLGVFFFVGVGLWLIGFVVEVTSDLQKSRFRSIPSNRGRFISTGLWSWSQHPNYFGEITMWVGISVAAVANLSGWQFVGLLSPVFVVVLLTKVSGIPLLQEKAASKWGNDSDFRDYQERTSLLVPLPPRHPRGRR